MEPPLPGLTIFVVNAFMKLDPADYRLSFCIDSTIPLLLNPNLKHVTINMWLYLLIYVGPGQKFKNQFHTTILGLNPENLSVYTLKRQNEYLKMMLFLTQLSRRLTR